VNTRRHAEDLPQGIHLLNTLPFVYALFGSVRETTTFSADSSSSRCKSLAFAVALLFTAGTALAQDAPQYSASTQQNSSAQSSQDGWKRSNGGWPNQAGNRSCGPLRAVVRPHSAVISMSACAADIVPPSRTTPVVIAMVQSARPLPENAGSPRVVESFLPTRYLHVVFTLPHRLVPLVLQNKKVLYDLLFRTSAETLLEAASNPRHLGTEIGFFSVLHHSTSRFRCAIVP
jgi:hypothetical protein